ncbi:MAG: helix-turn-helix domain-containing protein [Acutalibacteraceae bacterium]|nr:helix-turn-helix domain-containing protein [Clostridiales bacterium]
MFSEKLRSLREIHGLSQQQVADALQVHRSTYSYYELGTSQPSFSTLIKLAKIYKVEPNFLLGFDEEEGQVLRCEEPYYISKKVDAPKYACDLSSDEQRIVLSYRLIKDKSKAEKALQDILFSEED